MTVHRHKNFEKQFEKLEPKLQRKAEAVLLRLANHPYDTRLRNHKLWGSLENRRAISVTGDVRIIFREEQNYQHIYLLAIGTHSQVY